MDYNVLKTHILDIQKASKEGNLVIFVGAGVSNNSGVPVWSELTDTFKKELPDFAKKISDDLKLAQIYKTSYPTKFLETVRTVLKDGEIVPNAIHNSILDLKPCHIITTNYDDLIEQACKGRFELYQKVSSDEDMISIPNTHIIVKMHGEYNKNNIVLAEQDYYDYSRNFPLLRAFVLSLLASKTVLFVGFSFDDINLKYILRDIQTVLCKKMRPVYMLTDTVLSYEQNRYMEEKGICSICLDKSTIDIFLQSRSYVVKCPKSITNPHGVNLFNQLNIILNFDNESDLLKLLVSCVTKYNDDLAVLGDYLPMVLPKEVARHLRRDAYTMHIDKDFLESITGKISNKSELRHFICKYQDIYEELRNILYKNSIYYINGITVISNSYLRKRQLKAKYDCLDMEYLGNYIGAVNRVIQLNGSPCSLTAKDLELPFALYRMGKFEKAFEITESLSSTYWDNRKYILYLICRINLIHLALRINTKPNSILKDKAKRISSVSIEDVLRETPLDEEIRKVFENLVSYHLLITKESRTRELKERIKEQGEIAANGGFSWNNHSVELLYDFSSLIDFSMSNYIMLDTSSYSIRAFRNIAEGLINSLLIPGDEFRNSKVKAFIPQMLLLMVNHLQNEDLTKIMSVCGNNTLDIDESSVNLLKTMTRNIYESVTTYNHIVKEYFASSQICDRIRNICELLCWLPDRCMPDTYWYDVIAKHIRITDEKAYCRLLPVLIKKKMPTSEAAENLMQIFLHPIRKSESSPDLIEDLVKIIEAENKQFTKVEPWEMYDNVNYCCLAVLFPILSAEKQKSLTEYLKNNVSFLVEAVAIEITTPCKILDYTLFNKLLASMDDPNYPYNRDQTLLWLKRLYNTEGYEQFHPAIDELSQKEPFLKFILNPTANMDNMREDWILWLEDKELCNVVGNKEVMRRIGKFSKEVYEDVSKEIKRRIWKVLTTAIE